MKLRHIADKLYALLARLLCLGMVALSLPVLGSLINPSSSHTGSFASACESVVLAAIDDPYLPLAKEIAAAENAPLVYSLAEATACRPTFLIWVTSPARLSDAAMVDFGLTMKQQVSVISSGIITGSTLEDARKLWERRSRVNNENLFAVNAANQAAHIADGRIIAFAPKKMITPLTQGNFKNTLALADYITFTGHGSNRALNLDDETKVMAGDVPALDGLVIATGSCQTVRPWNDDSIARKFVDQGAAAYSGFVYSPNSGYLLGGFDGLPFRYTWPDFPIGHVIQVQNHGTLQGFAYFPYHHLLGDPQIALQDEAPYRLLSDQLQGRQRTLTFSDVPAGVVPIRVAGGASYAFVEAVGITAAAEQDEFYNSRLQMANLSDDKLILLVHRGGDLTLRLHRQPPWYWFPLDVLLDSLDDTLIYNLQAGGDIIAIGFAIFPLLWVAGQVVRRHLSAKKMLLAAAMGAAAAIFQGVYGLARLGQVTIISKAVVFSPLGLVAAFLLCASGTLMYLQARSWLGKVMALWVMTFISWSSMVFLLGLFGAFNLFASIPTLGTPIYGYATSLLPASSFLLSFGSYLLMLEGAARLLKELKPSFPGV